MGAFFKGWRRKLGVVVLGLACVLIVAWIRSATVIDSQALSTKGNNTQFNLVSQNQCIGLQQFQSQLPLRLESGKCDRVHFLVQIPGQNVSIWKTWIFSGGYKWTTRRFGFASGKMAIESGDVQGKIWIIPYWSVVMPLTLLSAYLLLSKPRLRPIQPVRHG